MKNLLRLCGAAVLFGVIAGGAMSATNTLTAAIFRIDQSPDTCAQMTTRTDMTIPVVMFTPCLPGVPFAFDFSPAAGAPSVEYGSNGFAWGHGCDKHPQTTDPLRCLKFLVRDGWAEFGTQSFNGAPCYGAAFSVDAAPFITLDCDNYITFHKRVILPTMSGPCNATTKGLVFIHPTTDRFMGCNGLVWRFLD
jgi:hypothetical protein